jgi:hypothetical protein
LGENHEKVLGFGLHQLRNRCSLAVAGGDNRISNRYSYNIFFCPGTLIHTSHLLAHLFQAVQDADGDGKFVLRLVAEASDEVVRRDAQGES